MEEVLGQMMELGVEIGKLKGENNALKEENKRLKEINDQVIGSLEKLAMGDKSPEKFKFGEGYHRQNNE